MRGIILSAIAVAGLGACSSTIAAAPTPVPASKIAEVASPGAHRISPIAFRSDTAEVALSPKGVKGDKVEYMVRMTADETLTYSWDAPDAVDFWHEFHGHTDKTVTFYKKAAGSSHKGVLTAPFDGSHGWYFENRTDKPVIVHIQLGGFYTLEKK